jgi:hypothetical protein
MKYLNHIIKTKSNMGIRTTKEILKEWCEKNLSTHTDWTGTRVETKYKCNSIDDFVDELYEHLEDNHYRC